MRNNNDDDNNDNNNNNIYRLKNPMFTKLKNRCKKGRTILHLSMNK